MTDDHSHIVPYRTFILVWLALLALTGFPLKFADRSWAKTVIDTFGGLDYSRLVHHWAGLALVTFALVFPEAGAPRWIFVAVLALEAGELVPVTVDGWKNPAYLDPAARWPRHAGPPLRACSPLESCETSSQPTSIPP